MSKMRKKITTLLFFTAALLLFGNEAVIGQELNDSWSANPTWNASSTFRGFAYGNNRIYVGGREGWPSAGSVRVLNAINGVEIGTLDNSGIPDLTFDLADAEFSDDGSILAAPLTLDASVASGWGKGNFTIWRWKDENSAPEPFIVYKGAGRVDMFTVVGDITGNAVVMGAISGTSTVWRYIISDGEIGEVEEITLADSISTGSVAVAYPTGLTAEDGFWYNNTDINPVLVDKNGAMVDTVPAALFEGVNGQLKTFSHDSKDYLLLVDNGKAKLINITDKAPHELTNDDIVYTSQGVYNINQDVDYRIGGDGEITVYAFSANNGIYSGSTEAAPVATDLLLTGFSLVGQSSQVTYTYADINDDLEGTSEIRWFLSDDKQGTNKTEIADNAGEMTYTYVEDDISKWISFTVFPTALSGTVNDSINLVESKLYGPIAPADAVAPVAVIDTIIGDVVVDGVLTAEYTYSDENDDAEGESIIKWYRADNEFGANKVEVASDTLQYKLLPEDGNKYIIFSVIPVAQTGTLLEGEEAWMPTDSAAFYPEFVPVASNLKIEGIEEVTRTLTGSYEYSDLNYDEESGTAQTWYRADAADGEKTVVGIESNQYELTKADSGKFVFYGVKPISAGALLKSGTGLYEFNDESDLWKNTAAGNGLNTVEVEGVFKRESDADVASTVNTDYSFVDGMHGKAVSMQANNWLKVWHGIPANGEGSYVNDFTVVMDVQVADSNGVYSLLEVNPGSSASGYTSELEIDSLRLGSVGAPASGADALGFSTDSIDVNKYYRITYVAKLAEYIKVYVDGVLVNTIEGDFTDARPAPYTADHNPDKAAIRIGGNNELDRDGDKIIDMLAVYGRSLSDAEVALLGEAGDQAEDINIGEEVFAVTGEIQPTPPEGAPEAQDVMVYGNPEVGAVLYTSYTYYDYTDDPEGESIYKWYAADDGEGTNATLIEGADKESYVVAADYVGKYIMFEVTPVAQTGGLLEGNPVMVGTSAATIESTQDFGLERMWIASEKTGAIPTYMNPAVTTERGMAASNGEHMYIASRKEGADILIVNKTDGSFVGKLDMTGVAGGVYPINDVEVSEDGQIVAMPLHASTDFWLYKWENELAAPVKWLEATLPESARFDKFTLVGDVSGDAIVTAAAAGANKIYRWVIAGGVAGEMQTIDLGDYVQGTAAAAMPYSTSDTAWMLLDGKGIAPAIAKPDGTLLKSIPMVDDYNNYKIQSNSPNVFTHKGRTLAAFFQAMRKEPLGARALIVDITDTASIQIVDSTEYISNQQPWDGYLGEVDVVTTEDHYEIYMLQAKYGLAAWKGVIELPEFVSGITNWEGTEVYAEFTKALDNESLSASAENWTIMAGDAAATITNVSSTDEVITFTLESAIAYGDSVTLAYDGEANVAAFDGMLLAAFGPVGIESIVGVQAPVATDVDYTSDGNVFTGVYTYSDADGDVEGDSKYQWWYASDVDGTDALKVIGETQLTYTVTNDMAGKYIAFEVTPVAATGGDAYLEGEAVTSAFKIFTDVSDAFAATFSLYPNPVKDVLTVENCMDVRSIQVYDVTGRVVLTMENNGANTMTIPMNNFHKGVYFVKLNSENAATFVKRIVKE